MGPTMATVLVYDNLEEGDYTLWLDDRPVARGVHVGGGRVSEHTLWTGTTAQTSSETSSNRSTSTSPRSVIFSAGMTDRERNASI